MSLPSDTLLPINYKSFGFIDTKYEYNANWDIYWSFTYALTGSEHGFCTYLTTDSTTLSANPGQYLGYFENGRQLAIAFDSTGYFALSNTKTMEGLPLSEVKKNSIIIRDFSDKVIFNETLSSLDTSFILASSTKVFNTLRFKFCNGGKKLYIDYKNTDNIYKNLTSIQLSSYNISDNTIYYPGLTFCSPISSNSSEISTLFVKNFHVYGETKPPTYENTTFKPLTSIKLTSFTSISGISAFKV